MNLEILSRSEAMKYKPNDKVHLIRIFSSFALPMYYPLDNLESFASVKEYFFDDKWSRDWKEYSWVDINGEMFEKYFHGKKKQNPLTTKEVLMKNLESQGHLYERGTLFNPALGVRIFEDFDKIKNDIDTIVIHCERGENRSPAIGIFFNEYYDLGYKDLKEKFPGYRRFVYETMKEVGEYYKGKIFEPIC